MPSDFRWHSFLVSAGYLPDTNNIVANGCVNVKFISAIYDNLTTLAGYRKKIMW